MSNIKTHDILIVSSFEKMSDTLKRALGGERYRFVDVRKSMATARRELAERDYDVVIINSPLADGLGVDLAIDVTIKYRMGVIIIASSEISGDIEEKVTDYGIIVISKPAPLRVISTDVRLMCAIVDRLKGAEKKVGTLEEKMAEIRIINRAKWKLIESKKMTEDEAHTYIGKFAMDECITRGEAAKRILDD